MTTHHEDVLNESDRNHAGCTDGGSMEEFGLYGAGFGAGVLMPRSRPCHRQVARPIRPDQAERRPELSGPDATAGFRQDAAGSRSNFFEQGKHFSTVPGQGPDAGDSIPTSRRPRAFSPERRRETVRICRPPHPKAALRVMQRHLCSKVTGSRPRRPARQAPRGVDACQCSSIGYPHRRPNSR